MVIVASAAGAQDAPVECTRLRKATIATPQTVSRSRHAEASIRLRSFRLAPDILTAMEDPTPNPAFPTLTAAQLARIEVHGRRRITAPGEVLIEPGDKAPFFVVITGELQVVRPVDQAEALIVRHREGQFAGEANMISGRRAMARLRVSEPGEVIQLARE